MISTSGQRAMTYIAPIYEQSKVMQAIFDARGLEWDNAESMTQDIVLQLFPQTATWGLDYWEQLLGIPVDTEKPIEQRREYVLSRVIATGAANPKRIKDAAKAFSGGDISLTVSYPYTLTIQFVDTKGVPANMDDFKAAIERMVPAHMHTVYVYLFNTYAELHAFTNGHLKTYTHHELKEHTIT